MIETKVFDNSEPGIQRPTYVYRDARNLEERLQGLTAQVKPPVVAVSVSAPQAGTPRQVFGLSATESPIKQLDRTFSSVAVSYSRDANDKAFMGVKIWAQGYRGNPNWVALTDNHDSPAIFLLETTKETIVLKAQAFGTNVADFDAAPTTAVMLDGVLSAPPAPSISQTLTGVPLGYQFSFSQINLGATQDVIDSYRIYRFTSNTPGSATLIRTYKHDPTAVGAIAVQDNVGGGQTLYYWVTAVNTSGLESAKTAAQSGVVVSGNVTTNNASPINTNGTFTGANPLAQSGTSTTINVASFTMQWGFGTVAYNSGSVNPGSYGTWYVYADDPYYAGGAVTFLASSAPLTVYQGEGRIALGHVTTVAGGGGGGAGGGGGCPLSGAPVNLYGRPEWWTKRVLPCEDFIKIVTATGRYGIFSRNDRRYCSRGLLALTEWVAGDLALTEDGEERVVLVQEVKLPGATVDSYEARIGHVYSAWGFIGHNNKAP